QLDQTMRSQACLNENRDSISLVSDAFAGEDTGVWNERHIAGAHRVVEHLAKLRDCMAFENLPPLPSQTRDPAYQARLHRVHGHMDRAFKLDLQGDYSGAEADARAA